MTREELISECRHRFERGDTIEAIIEFLRASGCQKIDSIAVISKACGTGLAKAKELVHLSDVWKDRRASDDEFHEGLERDMLAVLDDERANAMSIWKKLRNWLHTSPRVHIRIEGVDSIRDLVDLIDRFLDGKVAYALEWDDFISWSHANPNIEDIRNRIAATEPLFFSGREGDRDQAILVLIDERNRAAALIGVAPRPRVLPKP